MNMEPNAIINREHLEFPPDIYDVKYELSTVLDGGEIDPDDNYKDSFTEHGYLTAGNVKYFTSQLYPALYYGKFVRYDYEKRSEVIDRFKFHHRYIDAFKDGQQEFDDKIIKSGISGTQELVIYLKGWLKKCEFILHDPEFLTYHLIKEYGRWAGIYSQIIELIGDDLRLQPHIKELAGDDTNLLQRIVKLISYDPNNLKNEPKPQPREIDSTRLEAYFKPQFKGINNGINQFETFIKDLEVDREKKIEFAYIAKMCFDGAQMNSRKPLRGRKPNFNGWYKIFCECVGCEKGKYKPNDLEKIPDDLRKLFNYLQ